MLSTIGDESQQWAIKVRCKIRGKSVSVEACGRITQSSEVSRNNVSG